MRHLDLFSGIGGFAYAIDQVWDNVEHIFCDNDKFCRQVLKKHWPESEIYDDIRKIDTNTFSKRLQGFKHEQAKRQPRQFDRTRQDQRPRPFILTGGFPCQPFSAAGLRRGTADDRHLWPEMLRVIRLTQPQWVIAENVRGLVTWSDGLVFEQVCTDLEAEGYEVQPLIIPAVAVNAPHRRDRIWFIAHRNGAGLEKKGAKQQAAGGGRESWGRDWPTVAAELCSVDDGLPVELDGLELSKPQHRKEQLKAYGNAIVPQVAVEIMQGILTTIER